MRYEAPAIPATAATARARAALARSLREGLDQRGYLEVETPIAVPVAGEEPHLRPFGAALTPDRPIPQGGVEGRRLLHLITTPQYAMKRLLPAAGFFRRYQFSRVFPDAEV